MKNNMLNFDPLTSFIWLLAHSNVLKREEFKNYGQDLTAGIRYKTSCTAHYHLTELSHFQFSKVISDATNYAACEWTPQSTELMEAPKKPNYFN